MRVLLIEDDSAMARSIELMLRSEGFNVYTTDLGEEGIDLGKLYDYDIIVLDLQLPDMSGFEVLKSLRLAKVQTPVLILSGNAIVEAKVKALGFGADDYMTTRRPHPGRRSPLQGTFAIGHHDRQTDGQSRRQDG
jgi:two-component system cell cycle response regulator CtrA